MIEYAKAFGLTAEQFAKNLDRGYQAEEPESAERMLENFQNFDRRIEYPEDLARELLIGQMDTPEKVLAALRRVVAMELAAHPQVRRNMRLAFIERATLTVRPTKLGVRNIEPWHPCGRFKYITHKPLRSLRNDDFLWIAKGRRDGLLTISISANLDDQTCMERYIDTDSQWWDTLLKLYLVDKVDECNMQWNEQRRLILQLAVDKILFPIFEKEVEARLTNEASVFVLEQCANAIRNSVSRKPIPRVIGDSSEDDGLSVLAIAPGSREFNTPTFAALLSSRGECVDFLKLDWLLLNPRARREVDQQRRKADVDKIRCGLGRERRRLQRHNAGSCH